MPDPFPSAGLLTVARQYAQRVLDPHRQGSDLAGDVQALAIAVIHLAGTCEYLTTLVSRHEDLCRCLAAELAARPPTTTATPPP